MVGKRLPEEVERLGVLLIGYPHGGVPVPPAEATLLEAALATFQLYAKVSPKAKVFGMVSVVLLLYDVSGVRCHALGRAARQPSVRPRCTWAAGCAELTLVHPPPALPSMHSVWTATLTALLGRVCSRRGTRLATQFLRSLPVGSCCVPYIIACCAGSFIVPADSFFLYKWRGSLVCDNLFCCMCLQSVMCCSWKFLCQHYRLC